MCVSVCECDCFFFFFFLPLNGLILIYRWISTTICRQSRSLLQSPIRCSQTTTRSICECGATVQISTLHYKQKHKSITYSWSFRDLTFKMWLNNITVLRYSLSNSYSRTSLNISRYYLSFLCSGCGIVKSLPPFLGLGFSLGRFWQSSPRISHCLHRRSLTL